MNRQTLSSAAMDCGVFLLAMAATRLAQQADRPITAVLIFLSGVIFISFRSGLVAGIIAAVSASFVYNFFLSEPAYRFGITTADEAVPLIAFNVAAILAATLIGKLRDSSRKAFVAQSETAFLLTVSDRLQSAVKVEDVENAIRGIVPHQGVTSVEMYLAREEGFLRPSTGQVEPDRLATLMDAARNDQIPRSSGVSIVDLVGARGSLGFIKFDLVGDTNERASQSNLQSIAAMLGLAVERCLLLGEVAEAQALARSEALKDALLSSVSHDLRTPVTVIQAAAGALASVDVDLPEEDRRLMLRAILDQCDRLNRFTAEMLDVGQIQAGISDEVLEVVDPAEIVQLAIRHIQSAYPSVAIDRQVAREQKFIRANSAMLEQALFNVIDNARKFSPEGESIHIALAHVQDHAIIEVSDLGPGIAERDRGQIFRRFFKGGATGNDAGLGLGLFIAKGFVEAFHGTIEIECPIRDSRGTSIIIKLPLVARRIVTESDLCAS